MSEDSMRHRVRWSDNDRYFGPFTYAHDHGGRIAAVLGSGDDDDRSCTFRVSAFNRTLIVALPPILAPWRVKVMAPTWDAATVARMGRDWYYNVSPREYGFSCGEGFLQVFHGRQTYDSTTTDSWCCFLPWTQWRHVRHSVYGLFGEHIATEPKRASPKLGASEAAAAWRAWHDRVRAAPTRTFAFVDFDGQYLTATTRIEEREWRFGTGAFRWLSAFRRPKIARSLDIDFSDETGRRKGSWKGGTTGHSIEMRPGELHEEAFRRYCGEHEMTFVGPSLPKVSVPAA